MYTPYKITLPIGVSSSVPLLLRLKRAFLLPFLFFLFLLPPPPNLSFSSALEANVLRLPFLQRHTLYWWQASGRSLSWSRTTTSATWINLCCITAGKLDQQRWCLCWRSTELDQVIRKVFLILYLVVLRCIVYPIFNLLAKEIPIFMQGQLTKINQTISDPPNRHLLVWHTIWSILCDICSRWRICFWFQDQHQKRDHPPFRSLCSVWPQNAHWHKKTLKTECVFFPPPGFFNTRKLPLTYLYNSTLALQKK